MTNKEIIIIRIMINIFIIKHDSMTNKKIFIKIYSM